MPYCCVTKCGKHCGHRFPTTDKLLRKAWICAVRRKNNWEPSRHSIVCYDHFKEDDYVKESFYVGLPVLRRTLKKGTVPSVFPWKPVSPVINIETEMANTIHATLESHCRICGDAQSANSLQSIFEGDDPTLHDKIKTCIPVKISKEDGLPQNICEPCTLRIHIAYDVIQDSIKADVYFNDFILNGQNVADRSQEDMNEASTSGVKTFTQVTENVPQKSSLSSSSVQQPDRIQNESSSAVAVIVIQRDAKQNSKDCLKLVLVPKDGSDEPIPERVKAALALDYAQKKKEATSYSCHHCKVTFSNKQEQILHYQAEHPTEVFECPTCEATICGAPELILRHQELHSMLPNLNSEADMLEYMTSQVKVEVQDDEETAPQVKAIDLGIFNTALTGIAAQKQKERLIAVASHHSDIPKHFKDYVLDSLKNFLIKNSRVGKTTGAKLKTLPTSTVHTKNNIKTKATGKYIQCKICSRKLCSKESLEKHRINAHLPKIDRAKCIHCGKRYADEDLTSHIELRHSGGSYLMCDICDLNYAKTGEEQPHMMLAPVLQCNICNLIFKEKGAFKDHKYDAHEVSDFQCDICGQFLKTRASLKSHMQQVHLRDDCVCTICNKTCKNSASYRNHFFANHKESEACTCDMCGAMVPKLRIRRHIYNHISNKTQKKCEACNRMLGLSAWKYHKKIHQIYGNDYIPVPMYIRNSKNKNKSNTCRYCGKVLKSIQGLLYHESLHSGGTEQKVLPGRKCKPKPEKEKKPKPVKQKKEKPPKVVKPKKEKVKKVKVPVVKKPKPPPPPPIEIIRRECQHCRKILNLDVWNYHQLFHELFGSEAEVPFSVTGNMAYLHKLCNVQPLDIQPPDLRQENLTEFFPTIEDTELLKREKRRLSSNEWGRQMVPCKLCSKLVKRYSMGAHLRTHKEKDSLECDFCKKIFSRKQSLTTHMKLHLKVGGHECSYCGKYLRSPSMLVSHEAAHRGDRNYKCPFCPKSFPGIHHVQNHIGNVHHKTRKARQ